MKRKTRKRLFSLALACVLAVGLMPENNLAVYAEESEAVLETVTQTDPESVSEVPEASEPEKAPESPEKSEPEKTPESPEKSEPEKAPESPKGSEPEKAPESPEETEPEKAPESPKETEPEKAPEAPEEPVPESTPEPEEDVAPAELELEGETATYIPDAGDLPDNDELFAGYVMRMMYGENGIATLGNYGEDTLTGLDAGIYQALKEKIAAVAEGKEASTSFTLTWEELGVTKTEWTEEELGVPIADGNSISDAAVQTVTEKVGYDPGRISEIVDYLLVNCPYEMYWYDKTEGVSRPISVAVRALLSSTGNSIFLKEGGLTFKFAVAGAYAGSEAYTTDTAKTGAASVAAANAQAVISANEGKSDYEKLTAYRDYICNAVSYNDAAAKDDYTGGYGDPWQLIYVFDGDSSTNVVCEGYSKAFQYLCDLGGLTCYTVTGTMSGGTGAGAHMWNIVTLDGQNYLVDVTNSDAGSVGAYGGLFLAGAPEGTAEGYTIHIPEHDLGGGSYTLATSVTYAYDEDTIALYSADILTLAKTDYTEPEPEPEETLVAKVTVGGETKTYGYMEGPDGEAAAKALDDALAYACQNSTDGDPAVVTLLGDLEAPEQWVFAVDGGNVILDGGDFTISGNLSSFDYGLITVLDGAKLTIQSGTFRNIRGSGLFQHVYTVLVSKGGSLVIEDGEIFAQMNGASDSAGVYIRGSAEINGGTITANNLSASVNNAGHGVVAEGDDAEVTIRGGEMTGKTAGLYVYFGVAHLTGGVYTGNEHAIQYTEHNGTSEIGSLLEPGNAYYEGGTAEGTAKYNINTTGRHLPAGTYTVGLCTNHGYGSFSDAGDGTHSSTCIFCGSESASQPHNYNAWTQDDTVWYHECADCGAKEYAVASVTTGGTTSFYGTIEEAWAAAKGKPDGATITLLANAEAQSPLTVETGDDITLSMADGAVLTAVYDSTEGAFPNGVTLYGGRLTLENGTITAVAGYIGVMVYDGTFVMKGGTAEGQYGIYQAPDAGKGYDGGEVIVRGGEIRGDSIGFLTHGGVAKLSGGTFSGGDLSICTFKESPNVGGLLEKGYAYLQPGNTDDIWVTDTSVTFVKGTIIVEQAPIQSVTATADKTSLTYGATAPTLTAGVKLADTSMSVTYKWYQDGAEIAGATSATYTPGKLDAGEYTYTCKATADGYSLTSSPVTVKVDQRELELAFTGTTVKTYDGTTDGPAGLSVEIKNAVSGDNVTVTAESYTYNSANVVEADTITANGVTLSGDDADNYKLPEGAVTVGGTIKKSTPVITFLDSSVTETYSGEALNYPFEKGMTVDGALIEDVEFSWKDSEGKTLDSAPINAGTYTIIATIAETDNTAEATASTTVTIEPKPVSSPVITLEKDSYEYDGTEKKPTVTVFDGETEIDPKEYTVTYANNVNVGTNATVTITNKEGGNYKIDESTASFQITKPDLTTATVTLALPEDGYTYDGTAKEPGVTVVKNGVTVDPSEYDVAYSDNVNAGTATVTVTAVENGNYTGSQSAWFKIEKATPDLGTVGYTGTIFPTTALADITLTRTNETVSGTLALDAGQTLTVGEGTYTWTFIPDDADNYNEVTGTVTLEVTKDSLKGISIGTTAPDKKAYTYGDAFDPTGLTVTATYASGNTADVTDKVTFGALAVDQTSIELSYTEDGVTETCTVTGITVAKKQLDVSGMSWNVGTYIYDGTAQGPAFNGTLPAGVTITTTNDSKTDAGTYIARAGFTLADGYSAENYEIINGDPLTVEWTIAQRTAELTWSNTSLIYNGTAQQPTAAVSNLIADDACTVTVDGAQTDAGSYTGAAVGLSNSNYKLPDDTACAFVIGAKDITVNITPNSGVYDGTITPATAEPVGVVDGDTVNVTLTYTGTANDGTKVDSTDVPTLAGTYTVTASIEDGNYSLTGTVTAEFVVARANAGLSVSPESAAKTYGDEAFALTASHKGSGAVTYVSSNEDVATVDETGTVTLRGAGEAVITVTLAQTDNYEGGEITVTITVARKNDTLTVDKLTYEVVYGDGDFSIGYKTESGSKAAFVSSDTSVASVDETGKVHIVGAGTAAITLQTEQSQNYNAVSENVTVIVAQKAVTVTAEDKRKVYGEDDPALTYMATGVLDGDDLNIDLNHTPGEDVGEYDITADLTKANPNYEIKFVPGKLTVEQRTVTLTWGDTSLIYNGRAQHPAVTVGNLLTGDTCDVTVDGAETNVGSYTATVTGLGNGNYKLPDNVTMAFAIAPKDITVNITPNGGKYGAVTGAEAKLIGVVSGDTVPVTLTYTGTANDGTEVFSTDVPTLAGKYTVTADIDNSNYSLTGIVAADFVVARAGAELSVSPVPDKVYGDADFTLKESHKGDGVVTYASSNADVATVDGDGNVTLHKAGEAAITVTLAQTDNYEGDEIRVAIQVDKAGDRLTVEKLTYEVTYGDADFIIAPTTDSGSKVTFTSSNTSVAAVDETGKVHITGAGEAEITLETAESENYNAVSRIVTVTVKPKDISGASVELGDALIANGQTQTQEIRSVTVTNSKGEKLEATYTVSGNTGKEAGAYTMTLTGTGNFTGTCTVSFVIASEADKETDKNGGHSSSGKHDSGSDGEESGSAAVSAPAASAGGAARTGDDTNLWFFVLLLILSGGGVFAVFFYRRKNRKTE